MRLLVVSHTPHHHRDGELVGWAATVRELDALASLVDEVVHVAPLHPGPAPSAAEAHRAGNVRLVPVRASGGTGWRGKLDAAAAVVGYARAVRAALRHADAVHVRCPANIALVALAVLCLAKRPDVRWYKYAGEWRSRPGEPASYRFQRWLLRRGVRLHRGVVTVNGRWARQPGHVRSFDNPALAADDLRHGERTFDEGGPLRLLFVGRMTSDKRAPLTVEVVRQLDRAGVAVELDLVGDGPDLDAVSEAAAPLRGIVRVHGALARSALGPVYREAHLLLVPSETEGFPKVVAEAAAAGVVPLVAPIPAVGQLLAEEGFGAVVDPTPEAFAAAARAYGDDPQRWSGESRRAMVAAQRFTYDRYLDAVREVLHV